MQAIEKEMLIYGAGAGIISEKCKNGVITMNVEKMKFKAAFRVTKVKAFFKLGYYNFLKKFNLEGDDYFVCHLIRTNLRGILQTTAEQEYLEAHGLLPSETEEAEAEAAEREEGLLRELTLGEVLPICLNGNGYMALEIKEYEDKTCILLCITDDEYTEREENICAPHEAGQIYDRFSLDGRDWRWDREDNVLRPTPLLPDDAEVRELMDGVVLLGKQILRIEKAFAEEKLSPLCLEYAFSSSEDGYEWCMADYSAYPALYELKIPVGIVDRYLCGYSCRYWKSISGFEN